MKLVDQSIMHDPENGKWGDCFRACMASIFSQPIDSVPHHNKEISGEDQDRMINEWLVQFGLSLQPMTVDADYFRFMNKVMGVKSIVHIISGYTDRGTYHAVVGENGKVIHDPHPSKSGLLPNSPENEWRYTFFMMTHPQLKVDVKPLRSSLRIS